MAATADTIFDLIKSYENQFPIPAPYVTLPVGAFNAATGAFSGLTTKSETDPEPIEHGPNQHPTNPAPHFQGDEWISITIDSRWRRTVTTSPAPHVALGPVLLRFTISNASAPWTVNAGGVTVSAPAAQTTLTVGIWDEAIVPWSVQCGAQSYHDVLRIQRPAGVVGVGIGAFTIPVLPVTIVYAPPVDSLKLSAATYTQGQTVGTTVTTSFGTDTGQTVPNINTAYGGVAGFKAGLDTITQILGLVSGSTAETAAKAFGDISAQIGQIGSTTQTGVSDLTEDAMTLTQTTSDAIATNANAGGPGAGDVIHFYKNLRMAWSFFNGQLRLCPLGFEEVFVAVAGLQNNLATIGISQADAQLLLSFDPLLGGAQAVLPGDRFTLEETWEYGFGASLDHQVSVTRDAKSTTTTKNYTTSTDEWDPGPIFKIFGLGEKDQTTVTVSNAIGTDVSSTVTMDAKLASGPQDYFVVSIFYDNLFGTFAFQPSSPSPSNRIHGTGAASSQQVTLRAGGKVYRTVADKNGHFVFRSRTIPAGSAMVTVGNQAPRPVTVTRP